MFINCEQIFFLRSRYQENAEEDDSVADGRNGNVSDEQGSLQEEWQVHVQVWRATLP